MSPGTGQASIGRVGPPPRSARYHLPCLGEPGSDCASIPRGRELRTSTAEKTSFRSDRSDVIRDKAADHEQVSS